MRNQTQDGLNDKPYIVMKLNRRRCQPKLEELRRRTRRSWPSIVELLLERATVRDLMLAPDSDMRPEDLERGRA